MSTDILEGFEQSLLRGIAERFRVVDYHKAAIAFAGFQGGRGGDRADRLDGQRVGKGRATEFFLNRDRPIADIGVTIVRDLAAGLAVATRDRVGGIGTD